MIVPDSKGFTYTRDSLLNLTFPETPNCFSDFSLPRPANLSSNETSISLSPGYVCYLEIFQDF